MISILLIEDNPGDARLIQETLKDADNTFEQFSIIHVERVSKAIEALQSDTHIDIILSDLTLPDSSGLDTLFQFRDVAFELPIIFMTGTNDEELASTAILNGAQDYIIKGRYDGNSLATSIRFSLERKKSQIEVQEIHIREEASKVKIKLLADQKRQLLKINRIKDDFISIASHQLRTPATAVKQYVAMVRDGYVGDITDEQRDFLDKAFDSNERELAIIDELLKTVQLDSAEYQLNRTSMNFSDTIVNSIKQLKPSINAKKLNIITSLPDTALIKGDPNELKLVVDNLIENAIKYSPDNSKIFVELKIASKKIILKVRDEGVGIDETNYDVIFEKFSRVDNDMSDTVSGTGLGLYWVKKIVKHHKGTIKVESKLHQGTEFTVSLPIL